MIKRVSVCFFVSDLHGRVGRYRKLFDSIFKERPEAVFMGGDLLPMAWAPMESFDPLRQDFVNDFLAENLSCLRQELGPHYPRFFLIIGNDDSRFEEAAVLSVASSGLWEYIASRRVKFGEASVYGYPYVPPTPFFLKDWERYDVSRYVDPGCISPEEGVRSVPVSEREKKFSTISEDLERLAAGDDLAKAIFLFHAPPYRTKLDVSSGEGKMIDHVPFDIHLGSIAIRRFIEARQPLLTLHGHAHEAAGVSGSWRDRIGRTHCLSAAHDGPELALVRFDLNRLDDATRELI
jgi:Icc-related predicted phosphoesterase